MRRPRSYRFDAGACRLVVHDWGGDGPPVLLAHATGFHGVVWAPVAERLIAARHRVWSFDFRGHGDSDVPAVETGAYSWAGFADDVLAVTLHLGLTGDRALVACGHSKGGAALLLGEAKQPGTYSRIWAYEPIMFPAAPPPENDRLGASARKRRNEFTSKDEAYDNYASKPPLDTLTPETLRAYVDYGLRDRGDGVVALKCRPEVEAETYAMAPDNGAWNVLPAVDADVLVACGAVSRSIDPDLARRISERLPHGRLEVFPGLGHFGPQQDPDAIAASIRRFATP